MLVKKISHLIRARFPYIYITTFEEERVTSLLNSIVTNEKLVKYPREVYVWTQTKGFVNYGSNKQIAGTSCPCKALEFIQKHDKDSVFVFYDLHVSFGINNRPPDYNLIRNLRDLVAFLKTSKIRKNVFFVAPELIIPSTLQKDITILDLPLPRLPEIKSKLDKMIQQNAGVNAKELSEDDKEKLCKAAQGLTLKEIENAFALSMVNDGSISVEDLKTIMDEKMQVIKKKGI